jgi:hypothetical protein
MIKARTLIALMTVACALAATAASALAATENFKVEKGAMGKSVNSVFSTSKEGPAVKCEKTQYTTSQSGLVEVLELKPSYEGCKARAGGVEVSAKVVPKEAVYKLLVNPEEPAALITVDISGGVQIGVGSGESLCEVNIEAVASKPGLPRVSWENVKETGGSLLSEATEEVTKVPFKSKGAFCKLVGVAEKAETGELKGTAEVQDVDMPMRRHFKATNGGMTTVNPKNPANTRHVFVFGPGTNKVECKKAKFTGSINNVSTTLTLTPAYEECELIETGQANRVANISATGICSYIFSQPYVLGTMFTDGWTLSPNTCKTLFTFPAIAGCEVKMEPNAAIGQPTALVEMTNTGGAPPTGLLFKLAIRGFAYASNVACPAAFSRGSLLGSYSGEIKEEGEGIVIG